MSKLAVVTGGAVRVGEAISRSLAAAGYHVVVHGFSHGARAQRLADEINGSAVCADLSATEGPRVLFEHVDSVGGDLIALVNNAGIFHPSPPEEVTDAMWEQHIAVNLTAPFRCAQLAAPRMRAAGGGAIVNLLDVAALRPERDYVHYSATKAGLEAITKGLATQWAPTIRVNGVAPGAALMPDDFSEAERAARLVRTPMGEEPGADALAETVRFLIDGPRAITGTVINVDGGLSASW